MTRKTKALSKASQEAYFRRVLKTFPDMPEPAREAILARLQRDVSQIRIRAHAQAEFASAANVEIAPTASAASEAVEEVFDPFALNVLVTLRQQGRDAALEALNAIANTENLKLLAREQRLNIDDGLASSADLSAAIVTAAERRLANRRAAASAR